MAKIRALPVELLLQVFSEIPLYFSHFTSNTDGLVRLSRVCRLWRSILFGTTTRAIWSKFTLDVAYRAHYKIEDLFTLSGTVPLDIVVESRTWRLYCHLEANSGRLRSLIVKRAVRFDNLSHTLKGALPLLEALALPDPGDLGASEDIWSKVDMSSSAPRLTRLHLSSHVALKKILWPFSQITILELSIPRGNGYYSAATRADVISKFPNLVELYDTTLWLEPKADATPITLNLVCLKKLKARIHLLRWFIIYAPKLEEFEPHGDIIGLCTDKNASLAKRLKGPIRTLHITKANACNLDFGYSEKEEDEGDSSQDESTSSPTKRIRRIVASNFSSIINACKKGDTIPPTELLPLERLRTMYISLKTQDYGLLPWLYAMRVSKDSGAMLDLETLDITFPVDQRDLTKAFERVVLKLVESRIGGSLRCLRITYLYDSYTNIPASFPRGRSLRRQLEALQARAEGFEFMLRKKWEHVIGDYDEDEDAVDEAMETDDSDEERDNFFDNEPQ
ncbi:hypothetical protein CYLTODRAFT_447833 [Cylindrobasidium torrendii FP15055 ss-10]|uniref:F-box domain-containing protein n=1 Tax=Cylindrobasidium torrendii FP15055 ss-10 TaxID=1314674 RepID=A0A0D7AUX4_9AGAR|nr:hypothetical protein CYLTODRAFT_447833 [Cylindrobasidium torrendii FP15055 ss-10]